MADEFSTRGMSRRDAIRRAAKLGLLVLLAPGELLAKDAPAVVKQRVTLVLVNDLDRMSDKDGRGGHARLASVVRAERARGNTLFIHAGDALSPSILAGFDKGFHIIEILNRIAPDVFTPGNHEFDFGASNFRARMAQARFDVVAANIHEKDGRLVDGLKATKMIDVGAVRIGFVGVCTEDTAYLSTPEDIKFSPALTVAVEQSRALREAGADVVVAVTHIGFDADMALVRTGAADVVLSGHDHNLLTFWNGRVALVESASQADYVTPVDLFVEISEVDGKRRAKFVPGFRPIDTSAVAPDPEIAALVAHFEAELDSNLSVAIGTTSTPLDTRSNLVRSSETAFGNLICDAIRAAVGADIAITNGGGIRGNRTYPAGTTLTRRDIFEELPFGNRTVLLEANGKTIRAALEHGLSGDGRFPQVSGVTLVADMTRPAGERIVSLTAAGAPIDEAKLYRLATNDYMARGGDGYVMLKEAKVLIDPLAAQYMAGQVLAYVTKAGTIAPAVEGRVELRR